ncbi:agmatine deiminase family protein [Streptomyces sp. CA-250714]|uniref:agmatine deiminase family protein n=1 Tax=Streptomyces sp. CA-250714 TaxID=3240060 RepID=UPI003D946269
MAVFSRSRRAVLAGGAVVALAGVAARSSAGRTPAAAAHASTPAASEDGSSPAVAADGSTAGGGPADGGRMSDESVPHARTFMAWPTRRIWGADTRRVRADIARIARTIADYEPVTLLAGPLEAAAARRAVGSRVHVLVQPVDDLWLRDTGPVFIDTDRGQAGVDFHFNGWGGKQQHRRDSRVAAAVLRHTGVRRISAPLTAEGGSLEVDGRGTLLATESSLVNENRNPGKSRDRIERELKALLGVSKVIWVEGLKGADITDFHIDALARFARPGTVVMSSPAEGAPDDKWRRAYQQARHIIERSTDAEGRKLRVVDIPEADPGKAGVTSPDFLGSYVNYYVVNGAVILPRFGDTEADDRAAATVGELYPGRDIRQVDIGTLATGGGGIHCATQQQPEQRAVAR